jgi:hypothetical protein
MHFRTAWGDYFNVTYPNYYTSKQNLSDTSVYVSNCLFDSIESTSDGGALICTSVVYLLVEFSSFRSCKTSSRRGGAIYFSNTESSQCVLHGICGCDCCSTFAAGWSQGQFALIYLKNDTSSRNYFNYSSIARCVNEVNESHYTSRIDYGKICSTSVNISMSKCSRRSGIHHRPSGESNLVACSLTYSSYADNNATDFNCIYFSGANVKYEIKSCNIIRNTQSTLNSEGTIFTQGVLMIEDSCILENKADYIFFQLTSAYTITLSNCTVDSISNNQNLITQSTVTKSFILGLNHVSTYYCHSEYDSVGTLTPIIQPPAKRLYFTYGKYFCQFQLSEFFSILSIFIFNFIHLHSSSNPCY